MVAVGQYFGRPRSSSRWYLAGGIWRWSLRRGDKLPRHIWARQAPFQRSSAADWAKATCQRANHYAGFNLLVFDGNSLYYLNNYQSTATALDPGIYAISNHSLDSPWPKVDYAKQQLRDNLAGHGPAHERLAELTSLLSRRQPYPDSRLPDTGIPHEWEKRLSSAFIISEDYGTRASTGVMVASSGEIAVMENCYELGIFKSSQRFTFQP